MSGAVHKILVAVRDYVNKVAFIQLLHLLPPNTQITFLHVVRFPLSASLYPELVSPLLDEGRRRFSELVEWAEAQGFSAELRVVAARDVVETILEEAEALDCELIVVQKSSKSLRERIVTPFYRTTSEKLIGVSRRPVAVLPP